MFKIRNMIAIVAIAVLSLSASAVQAQQCNVPQQNNVSSAAVLQQQAQQQALANLLTAQANANAVRSSSAVATTARSTQVTPPQIVLSAPIQQSAPVATASATASGGGGRSRSGGGFLGKLLPPKSVARTNRNGSTVAISRGG